MPDPVQNPQAQLIARHATASGIAELLKGGGQIGQVTAVYSNGRVDVQLQGRSFQFDAKGMPLKEGQFVQLRISRGQVLLEQSHAQTDARTAGAESARTTSLTAQLSQMGIQGPSAQVIAQALIQAGVPLDRTILQELTNLLPHAAANQVAALAFLFSRGLPISPSMATWALRLLMARPRIGQSLDRLLESLSDLEKESLEEEFELERRRVTELASLRERLHRHQRAFNEAGELPNLEEIADFIRQALASPEAQLAASNEKDPSTLGAAVLRLLQVLLELKPHVTDPRQFAMLQKAIENAQILHEHLAALAFRNLPVETHDQSQAYYLQIPIYSEDKSRQLEIAYYPHRDRDDAGRIELRVEMSRLGVVHASLLWERPRLDVSLIVETEKTRDLIDSVFNTLREGLQRHGFHVQSLRVEVGEVPLSIEPNRTPEDSPDAPQSNGVDIRA